MKLYTVYDITSELYSSPFSETNDMTARRRFLALLKNTQFDPTDFELFSCGTFDEKTCSFDPERRLICRGERDQKSI